MSRALLIEAADGEAVDPHIPHRPPGGPFDFEPDQMRDVIRGMLNQPTSSAKDRKRGDDQEVKGFMTLNEIALKTGVPKGWLLKKLNLPANTDARQPVREWMHAQGKSIQDLRDAVAEYRAQRN